VARNNPSRRRTAPAPGRSRVLETVETLVWRPKGLLLGVLFLVLFFVTARLPNIAASSGSHDLGSQMSYEFYAKNNYQFGIDVVQNVGPYGYLHFPRVYSGLLPWRKAIFILAFSVMFSAMVLLASRYFDGAVAVGTWLLLAIGTQIAVDPLMDAIFSVMDPIVYLFLLLAAHHLLTRDRYRSVVFFDVLLLAFLALISLMKSTSLMLVGSLMATVVAQQLLGRCWKAALRDAGCFAAAFLALWLLAGQRLATLPRFVQGCFAFSKGYNEVMAMYIPGESRLVGLAVGMFLVLAAANVLRLWRFREHRDRIFLTLWECALLFIVWKHGFVRADHSLFFWTFILPASPLLLLAHEPRRAQADTASPEELPGVGGAPAAAGAGLPGVGPLLRPARRVWRGIARAWTRLAAAVPLLPLAETAAVAVLALLAITSKEIHLESEAAVRARIRNEQIHPRLPGLLAGSERFRLLEQALAKNKKRAAAPAVEKKTGHAAVDEYGIFPGVMLLNDLNYRPRPMPITFGAVNERLMRQNEEFYRNDATAPRYIMAAVRFLDRFLPPQEDSLAMLQILRRYRPVYPIIFEQEHLLLERIRPAGPEPSLKPLGSPREYTWGERIAVPAAEGRLLWCQVVVEPTLVGRVRSSLYKPADVNICLERTGKAEVTLRFLTSAAQVGFLVNPLIANSVDLLAAFPTDETRGSLPSSPAPNALRFQVAPDDRRCFQDRITVSFSTMEKPRHEAGNSAENL
jgi:hypothetical protein